MQRSDLLTKPKSFSSYSNPINVIHGRNIFPKAEQYFKTHNENNVTWSTVQELGTHSFVGSLQLFSDKSQMSLTVSSFHFYSLHASQLNIPDKNRYSLIVSGTTDVAYVPVKFCSQESDIEKKVAQRKSFPERM